MRSGYLNGELVYVLGHSGHKPGQGSKYDEWETIKIYKHNDIIEQINHVLHSVMMDSRYSHCRHTNYCTEEFLQKIINVFDEALPQELKAWRLPSELKKDKDVILQTKKQVQGLVNQKKRLATHQCIDGLNSSKLKVIKGELYEPAAAPSFIADDILSDEFKAWRKAQQAKPESHDNA